MAVHIACQSLQDTDCHLAVAGGVSLIISPERSVYASKAGLLSPSGRCKAFSATADGYVRGEGCGIVLLKHSAIAAADDDTVHALVCGSATAKDRAAGGTSSDFLAQLLREGCLNASSAPGKCTFIEAHGSGDAAMDVMEAQAISKVFCGAGADVLVGTVKTNIGHLDAASGITSLIKTVLVLQQKQVPENLHLGIVNPRCALPGITFPSSLTPFGADGSYITASVNSFGSSGTSAHAVMQEAPDVPVGRAARAERPAHVVTISGPNPDALVAVAEQLEQCLAKTSMNLLDFAHSVNTGMMHFDNRISFVSTDIDSAQQTISEFVSRARIAGPENWETSLGDGFSGVCGDDMVKSCFLFSDNTVNCARAAELFALEPVFRAAVEECDREFQIITKQSYFSSMFSTPPQVAAVIATGTALSPNDKYAQVYQFAVQYAIGRLWISWGVHPAAVTGQGVGACAAMCIAGALGVAEAVSIATGYATFGRTIFRSATVCPFLDMEASEVRVSPHDFRTMNFSSEHDARDSLIANVAVTLEVLSLGEVLIDIGCTKPAPAVQNITIVSCGADWESMFHAAAELYTYGCNVDWRRADAPFGAQPVSMPAYPMHRKRCWIGEEYEHIAHTPSYDNFDDAQRSSPTISRPSKLPDLNTATPLVKELVQKLDRLPEPKRLRVVATTLHGLLNDSLPADKQQDLQQVVATTFADMGVDSNKMKLLTVTIGSQFGLQLHPTFLFNYPTLQIVAEYIASTLLGSLFPALAEVVPVAASSDINSPVAVIGMGCALPGGASSPQTFWDLLEKGEDAVIETPTSRWSEDLYEPTTVPGKMSTKWGGFLTEPIDMFDPAFFGLSKREADGMDPQQRLILETSHQALEHAGQPPFDVPGAPVGVFVGIFTNDYQLLQTRLTDLEDINSYFGTGNSSSVAAGRVSYVFGFEGPAIALDTACSSALVAAHLGCQSLTRGECLTALVSGVNLMLAPDMTINFSQAGMMSPDGRCKTFDASANGYVRGEGCGSLVLRKAADASADGDITMGIIRGTAINQDGRSSGLTAPTAGHSRQ